MRKLILWIVWALLLVIYAATVAALCHEGNYWALAFAGLNLACGLLLFYAEGFEVAFCMLWPARESAEAAVPKVLRKLDSEFILAQRQAVVVVTITIVSLTTGGFEWIAVPGVGRVHSCGAPDFFSLAFVTTTILWFGQVFPKRIAARDPMRFWKMSEWLLKPIGVAGRVLDLPAPSNDLVAWWDSLFGHAACPSTDLRSPWASCDCAVCNPKVVADGAHGNDGVACGCPICKPE